MLYVRVSNLDGKDLRAVKTTDFEEIGRRISGSVLSAYDRNAQDEEGQCYASVVMPVNGWRIVPPHKAVNILMINVQFDLFSDENDIIEQVMTAIEKWCKLQNGIEVISKKCAEHFSLYGYESGKEYLTHTLDGVFHNASQVNDVLDDFEYVTKWVAAYVESADIVKKNDIIVKYMYDSIISNLPYRFKIGCETDLRNGVAKVVRKKYTTEISGKLFYNFIKDMLEDNDIHCFITYLSRFIMEVRNKYELPDVIKNEITLLYR